MDPNKDVAHLTDQEGDMWSLIIGEFMAGEGHVIGTGWLSKQMMNPHATICPDAFGEDTECLAQNLQLKGTKGLKADVAKEAAAFICAEPRNAVAASPADV